MSDQDRAPLTLRHASKRASGTRGLLGLVGRQGRRYRECDQSHIQDVVNVLEYEDLRDVVLVGHSYGGMVITGVADRAADRLARIIYVDALLPRDGECLFDVDSPETRVSWE